MKIRSIVLFCVIYITAFAQTTTYSPEEEKMVQYVNMGLAYAMKYDTPERVNPVIDSCWNFLNKYPNSFVKPNVLSYLLEMTAIVSTDLNEINPLIDSVLYYDRLPTTKQRIGELLIGRNLDIEKGREFIFEALPNLTVPYHLYKSYILLASTDMQLGKYASAEMNLKNAIAIDSTRREALYEYNNLMMMRESPEQTKVIQSKINKLNKEAKLRYTGQSNLSPNINKNVLGISFYDVDSNLVTLDNLEGRVVVINRFNFWCPNCAKEFPTLQKLKKEFPLVEFVFVNSGETASELREKYYSKKEFSFLKNESVLFVTGDYFNKIHGYAVPHTYIVDKKGNIRLDYIGYRKELADILREKLTEILNE